MQNKKLYILFGLTIILVGAAAFVGGRWIDAFSSGDEPMSNVTPAPEIPATAPEVSGLLVERKDHTVILQSVSFDAGSGWHLGDSSAPMDTTSGPKVEVVVTGATILYRDSFEFGETSIQQTVQETSLDDLNSQMMITVWGRKEGDRVIADIVLAQSLKE